MALPFAVWHLTALIDVAVGSDEDAIDPESPAASLFWHMAATLVWPPIQTAILVFTLAYVPGAAHLGVVETVLIFLGIGIINGAVGIVFAHELMHQRSWLERAFADLLMSQVLYSHFRSEHLLVHHRYVGTPRDPVTARFGEGFHRYFARVLPACLVSAWGAERAALTRRKRPVWHRSNPFWRYGALQLFWLGLAFILAGWVGLALFVFQAFVAVWHLELVNYIEHYGLTRKHLGNGKYEPAQTRHSWNDSHSVTRRFLINLTRHSDHHARPDKPYPLLEAASPEAAPELPYGYSAMTAMAMVPPLWRRVMHPRVKKWRRQFYPEISDWGPYDRLETPMPR